MEKENNVECPVCGNFAYTDRANKNKMQGFHCISCGDYLIPVNVYYKFLGADNPRGLLIYPNENIKNTIKRYFASEEYLEKKKVDADKCIWAPSVWFCVDDGDFEYNGDSLRIKKDLLVLCDEYMSSNKHEEKIL